MTAGGGRSRHLSASMVEKINGGGGGGVSHREPWQKHSRNISAVSDISGSNAEPLKRDENAEIRCVLLCDSETERKCVFEAISKAICDGYSNITDCQILQHHWEQPHVDCAGMDCRFCFRVTSANASHPYGQPAGGSQPVGVHGVHFQPHPPIGVSHSVPHTTDYQHGSNGGLDGFFRFNIKGTTYRLMLLSKDRQNLLKIYSYDFVMVGMQIMSRRGHLEKDIWEFEWKRLERHSKKAAAPIIVFGYFRDVLKLSNGASYNEFSLKKTIDESRVEVKKMGRKHHAIPRFCDFVTGNSSQLEEIFMDVREMYLYPGFVLMQCAYVNNLVHFQKIIENPNVTEEDVQYKDKATGDNPIMIAAKLRHKDLVSAVLRSTRFLCIDGVGNVSDNVLSELIHAKNLNDQTLLAMVALQGPELEEQKLLILQKEIQTHCLSDLTHEADQLRLQRCLRNQLKSSAEAAIILEQARCLQGIPKTEKELRAENTKVWSRLFFASLLMSLVFNMIDTGSDILIMLRYYSEWMGNAIVSTNNTCGQDSEIYAEPMCNATLDGMAVMIDMQCFPLEMSAEQKFGYTLFFIAVPWPFFIYEFFTSRQYHNLVHQGASIIAEMSQCNGVLSFIRAYMKAILYSVSFVCCFLFWPIAVLFIKYYNDAKYYLAKGQQRAEREKKIEASEVLYSTARVMEVSLESSFQPTIQLYIMLPVLMRSLTAQTFTFKVFTVCKDKEKFPMLKTDQTISIVTSILSLAWCFTTYHATMKRGALDRDLAALFYRAVLFLSVLFQILGRLFILVLFSYNFGPGMYFPLLIFLGCHIVLMTMLHFVFSDAKRYWVKGGFLNLSFFHYMIGNGLANIYIHNWIRMDPLLIPHSKPLQHVSTLMRQLVFDLVFVVENVVLLSIALNSPIKELHENKVAIGIFLLAFTFIGLILKAVYYRYLHIWAWLIMDYIAKKEDGHWKCIIFSNMFLCGELKERELLLCCIPRPFFRCLDSLFGDRHFHRTTGTTCSLCSAVVGVFLIPVAVAVGLVVLSVCLILAVFFFPVFLVAVLPCVCFAKYRQMRDNDNVIKIVNSDSGREGFEMTKNLMEAEDGGNVITDAEAAEETAVTERHHWGEANGGIVRGQVVVNHTPHQSQSDFGKLQATAENGDDEAAAAAAVEDDDNKKCNNDLSDVDGASANNNCTVCVTTDN